MTLLNIYYLIMTAVSVSVDSFVGGAALGCGKSPRPARTALVAVCAVACLCAFASLLANMLEGFMARYAGYVGGCVLIAVGLSGLLKRETNVFARKRRVNDFFEALITGFGVGVDGACACFSLTLSGYGAEAALTVIFFHFVFIEAGILLAGMKNRADRTLITESANIERKIGCMLLLALGMFKFIE